MENKKHTKKALLGSVIALILCCAMLIGTTFAWFTDSASTGVSTIYSGELKVDLIDGSGNSMEGKSLTFISKDGAVLWEPGCSYELQDVYVKNTGNLALKYKIAINGLDGDAELLDVIDWKVKVGGEETDLDDYEGNLAAGMTSSQPISIVGTMQTTAGNLYQGKELEGISIVVYATQDTVESDSYTNQYDANAQYAWNGNVPAEMPESLVVTPDEENKTGTILVQDAQALVYLNKLAENWVSLYSNGQGTNVGCYYKDNGGKGGAYYYMWGWTVKLDADIDLNNLSVDPINISFWGHFDGQGHTISNASIVTDSKTENEAGLFNANQCSVKDVKLDNIRVTGSNVGNSTAGVLSGSCNQGINNVTVTNSSVTGGKYTGGVVGYGYTDVTDCTLENVTVKGGYKLGGVIGYICTSGSNTGEVTGNTLTNCTVVEGDHAGGKTDYVIGKVVGNYNCNGTCNNNTITNMTTSATANIGKIEAGVSVTQ